MSYHHYTASRITGNGNAVFPDEIIIEDDCVTYRKGQIVGYKETKINVAAIGSFSKDGLLHIRSIDCKWWYIDLWGNRKLDK